MRRAYFYALLEMVAPAFCVFGTPALCLLTGWVFGCARQGLVVLGGLWCLLEAAGLGLLGDGVVADCAEGFVPEPFVQHELGDDDSAGVPYVGEGVVGAGDPRLDGMDANAGRLPPLG